MAERYNRILLNMLETLEDYKKADWKYQLPAWFMSIHQLVMKVQAMPHII